MADHYLDANGEAERADAWGHLLSQTAPALRTDHQAIWIPAAGFGETGAARGALACVLASRAFARGYARNPQALVWLCAEDAARQALLRIDHHG
jgi:3-oxoacyl-[acyl-carrier-protein] synthase-1